MSWRKTPRDMITNPKIRYIAGHASPNLRQAVFAFYLMIYEAADDDGVIDLGDREVLADQLMLEIQYDFPDTTSIDWLIAQFVSRGFIEQMFPKDRDLSTYYYILDFDNPNEAHFSNNKRVAETADERRDRVYGRMRPQAAPAEPRRRVRAQAKFRRTDDGTDEDSPEPPEDGRPESAPAPCAGFFCAPQDSENDKMRDKISESVATIGRMRDTLAQNVAENPLLRIEREDRDQRDQTKERTEKDTHTQNPAPADNGVPVPCGTSAPPSAPCAGGDTQRPEHTQGAETCDTQTETGHAEGRDTEATLHDAEPPEEGSNMQQPPGTKWTYKDTAEAAKKMDMPEGVAARLIALKSYSDWQTCGVLWRFFKQRCPVPFEQDDVQLDAIQIITVSCSMMSEPKNPPYVIVGQLVALFWELVQSGGPDGKYFKGMPVTPSMMITKAVWPRIVSNARRKLHPGATAGEFWTKEVEKYRREAEKDAEKYNGGTFFGQQCAERGIDAGKPGAIATMLARQASESAQKGVETG